MSARNRYLPRYGLANLLRDEHMTPIVVDLGY
jgi:hypothetical protein